ncbi:MAG: hypothetical protein V1495_01160 [Pseudomonadota bacterium]
MNLDHDGYVKQLALTIDRDPGYGLLKYTIPSSDVKTDLIGRFYPDVTTLRKEGKARLLIEVIAPDSFEDDEEIPRLEALSKYCAEKKWEFYIAVTESAVKNLLETKIAGREIRPKSVWLVNESPFTPRLEAVT